MKKILLIFAALGAALSLSAQSIRTNYRSEGMTHISTDYEKLEDFEVRVELVGFPDSSWMYQLFIDLRQKVSFTASPAAPSSGPTRSAGTAPPSRG